MIGTSPPPAPAPARHEHSILLVDDDPTARRITRRALSLSTKSITIEEVGESTLAVPRAIATQPDLILLDLMMPGIDGMEVCRQLRGSESTRDIPIIMLTAHHDHATKLQAFGHGADAFLARPVNRVELCTRVDAVLDAARSRRLRESEQTATAILDSAPVGAMVLSGDGDLMHSNDKARELLGGHAALGPTLRMADADRFQRAVTAAMTQEGSITLRVIQAVSPPRQLEVALRRVRLRGIQRVVVFVLDMSSITDVAGDWLSAARQREDVVHRAAMLHDLASLLQVGYVQQDLLQSLVAGPSAALPVAQDLMTTLNGLTALVSELRALHGVTAADRAPLQGQSIAEIVRQLARRVRYIVPSNIRVHVPPDDALRGVDLTVPWVDDILLNLLTNARDAIGDDRGCITVTAQRVTGGVELQVRDDGPGIPDDILRQLGRPFQTTKVPGKGTGLGLWMITQRVASAGGRFTITRDAPRGTTATLWYPYPTAPGA